MSLTPICHNGAPVSLDHLAPLVIACPCNVIGRDLTINAIFRTHCYTEKFDPIKHTRDQIVLYDAPARPRVFCPIRHRLSFKLPELISVIPKEKVFQTSQRRNYLYAAKMSANDGIYEIYFMLQKANGGSTDLRLTVESAYPVVEASPVPNRPNKIRFAVLALKVFRCEAVRFAAR